MLHSDDADINKVIREIIELDKKAVRIKTNVSEMAEKIIENTKKEIRENKDAEIKKVQELTQKNYEIEITKANNERLSIIHSKEQELIQIRQKYDVEKDKKAMEIVEELFKNPARSMNT